MAEAERTESDVWSALASGDVGRVEELTRDLEHVPLGSRTRRRLELARVTALKRGGRDDEATQTLKLAWERHLLSDLQEELDRESLLSPAAAVWESLRAEQARALAKKRRSAITSVLALVVLAVVALGCGYLSLVYPTRSEAGKTSTRFVRAVGARDSNAAGDLLSSARKSKLGSQGLLTAVPARMHGASGLDINGIERRTSGSATISCIEGVLEYPAGTEPPEPSKRISFKLVEEDGSLKIDGWSDRWCRFSGYWR